MELPNLDTASYEEIRAEMIAAIPRYSKNWTDFNASDPGITCLELLSWIAENLLYTINQVDENSYLNFLYLLAGAIAEQVEATLKEELLDTINDPQQNDIPLYADPAAIQLLQFLKKVQQGYQPSIQELQLVALTYRKAGYRTITQTDFETQAVKSTASLINQLDGQSDSNEVKIVSRAVALDENGGVTIIVFAAKPFKFTQSKPTRAELASDATITSVYEFDPSSKVSDLDYTDLTKVVSEFLKPRRLLGVVFEVKAPEFTKVYMVVSVIVRLGTQTQDVVSNIANAVEKFLDPLGGGEDGKGWPYNHPLSTSSVFSLIDAQTGVRNITSLSISTGQFQVKVFSTLGKDTFLGPLPQGNLYPVFGVTRLQHLVVKASIE